MAGAAAMPLPIQTVQDFRTAAELSSYEPAQLRRTIEEHEARIQAQDEIIEQQLRAIEQLEEKLGRMQQIKDSPAHADSFQLLAEISDLKERNKNLEEAQEHLEESFDHLFQVQLDFLEEALETLEKLSASPEGQEPLHQSQKAVQSDRESQGSRPSFRHQFPQADGRFAE
jgi:chromosome segregation ATPase